MAGNPRRAAEIGPTVKRLPSYLVKSCTEGVNVSAGPTSCGACGSKFHIEAGRITWMFDYGPNPDASEVCTGLVYYLNGELVHACDSVWEYEMTEDEIIQVRGELQNLVGKMRTSA